MKKIVTIVALSVFLVSCGGEQNSNLTTVEPTGNAVADSLRQALADQDSLLVLINEITDGMESLKQMEHILSSTATVGDLTSRRQQLRNDMAAIQQSIVNNRNRLAELESRLNKSNNNNANLRRAIVALKQQIAGQVTTIESLRSQLVEANIEIEQLNLNRDSLMAEIATTTEQRDEMIQQNYDLTNEINLCYYVVGSKSELKEHKIIETGFLRKTKVLPTDFEHEYFTAADKRNLSYIPLHSTKAEVMSNHPVDSYRIDSNNTNNQKTLVITNPQRFWSTSNYLVIKID